VDYDPDRDIAASTRARLQPVIDGLTRERDELRALLDQLRARRDEPAPATGASASALGDKVRGLKHPQLFDREESRNPIAAFNARVEAIAAEVDRTRAEHTAERIEDQRDDLRAEVRAYLLAVSDLRRLHSATMGYVAAAQRVEDGLARLRALVDDTRARLDTERADATPAARAAAVDRWLAELAELDRLAAKHTADRSDDQPVLCDAVRADAETRLDGDPINDEPSAPAPGTTDGE
jgi:hypothetical protein